MVLFVFWCLLFGIYSPVSADTYESVSIINSKNWAAYIGDHLGYLYDSHGCLHFTPSDIYLLTRTVPVGIPLKIHGYDQKNLPDGYAAAPVFHDLVNSTANIEKYAASFKTGQARLEVYPGLGRLFIVMNDSPVVQVKTRPGPEQYYMAAFYISGKNIRWDFTPTTPTDAGQYTILRTTDHYISPTYYDITIVPFGAWIQKQKGRWIFQDGQKWYQLPAVIGADLDQPYGWQDNDYYDFNLDSKGKISAARWANNDFGKYALLWTRDGKTRYPELGYCEGQLLYEQTVLIKGLSVILTFPGSDSIEACIAHNDDFKVYRDVYAFLSSRGEVQPASLDPVSCSYVRLFKGFKLGGTDNLNINQQALQAFKEVRADKLTGNEPARWRTRGLYNYIRDIAWTFDKWAGWYTMVKDDWPFFSDLRVKLRKDFDKFGIYAPANRQLTLERILNDRLEFRQFKPPPKI
ncbi:MAG: hypothetical protein PHG97_04620 [Candidatus Margulisbacteria bacterium]|nr:hypothetical protein [Candidatus Margulisiibacteriota bacterium]